MSNRIPVWKLKSQSDNRWYCKGCYLHCVKTSKTKPVVCKEEDESKLETRNTVRPQGLDL
jgi:hypothetical protein